MTVRVERIVTNIMFMFKFVANRAGAVTEAKVVTAVEASIEAAVGTAPAANLRTVRTATAERTETRTAIRTEISDAVKREDVAAPRSGAVNPATNETGKHTHT